MEIHVKTKHYPAVLALKNEPLPAGITVTVPPVIANRDGLSEAWATAIFSVAASVPASVIIDFFKHKFRNKHPTIITINRKEVNFEKGDIVSIIEESRKIEY